MQYVARAGLRSPSRICLRARNDTEIVGPQDILEHGRNNRVGIWPRRTDEIESSCRHAQSLTGQELFKGLAGWTSSLEVYEQERRNTSEQRRETGTIIKWFPE